MELLIFALVAPLALASPQEKLWVVAPLPGPGVDFIDLPTAVAQAGEGDTLLLRNGTYHETTIDGKSLTILGDPYAQVIGYLRVINLAPGQRVVLRNFEHSGVGGLVLAQNQGAVWVEDFRWRFLEAIGSRAVTAVGCEGGYGTVDSSNVAFFDCELHNTLFMGGSGLLVQGQSVVHVEGSELRGGGGAVGEVDPFGICTDGDPGGPGLALKGPSLCTLVDSELQGGSGGPPVFFTPCHKGPDGPPWTAEVLPPTFVSGTAHGLAVPSPALWPGTLPVEVSGPTGELAFLVVGAAQAPLFYPFSPLFGLLPGAPPLLSIGAPYVLISLGAFPGAGTLSFTAALGAPPAGVEAATLYVQGLFVGAGTAAFGEGAVLALADLGALDCNGNGLHDQVDIAAGTSCDKDGDGILDECQAPFADPGLAVELPESLAELNFGGSVALAGSTAVISMPETYYGNGRAFAYGAAADGTLTFEAELHPSDGASDFGVEVATAGDRVAVGATQHSHGTITGAVYLYQRVAPGVWVEEAELVATSSGLTGWGLGHSVALDGDLCAAGAPDIEGAGPGEVLVFHRTLSGAWIEEAVLKPSSPFAQMGFGGRVALEGDLLAATADELVYVFRRLPHGNWVEEARLDVPGLSVFLLQGDLALFGGRLAVGVPVDTPFTGKVRVFAKGTSGWILQAQLTAPEMGDGLGNAVAFDGDLLVAGAPVADSPLILGGAVHAWRDAGHGEWTYAGRLDPQPSLAPNPNYGPYLGGALAFDAGRLAAGAPGQDPGGAVVVWQTLPDCP